MKIMPVQKQSSAGQRTRFKAFVAVGDSAGHIGLGVKCSSEVATAIRGAITAAKLNVAPVRRGYWGRKSGLPHTVPCKVTGKCGSVRVRLIPAPRGTGLVSSPPARSCCTWPASTTATPAPAATPGPWATTSRPSSTPSATPTATSARALEGAGPPLLPLPGAHRLPLQEGPLNILLYFKRTRHSSKESNHLSKEGKTKACRGEAQ